MSGAEGVWSAWAAGVPRLAAIAAVVFVPGWLGARLLGMRGALSAAAAPLLTAVAAAIGALICGAAGIRWGAPSLVVCLAVMIAACALGRTLAGRSWTTDETGSAARPRTGLSRLTAIHPLVVVLPVAWLALVLPMAARMSPDTPIQGYDSLFHMNALWWILKDGNASSLGGLTPMFGQDTTSTIYPAGWHALVAPLASPATIVPTVNAFLLVVPLIWLTGLAGMARAVLPRVPVLPVLTVACVPLAAEFPTFMLTKYPAWPNALAASLVPALVAVAVEALRALRQEPTVSAARTAPADSTVPAVSADPARPRRWRAALAWGAMLAAVVGGACLVHPLAGASLALLAVAPGLVLVARRWVALERSGRTRRLWAEALGLWGACAALAVVVAAVPFLRHRLAEMTVAYRTVRNVDWYNPLKALSLWSIVDPGAPAGVAALQMAAAVAVVLLTAVGVVAAARSRAGRPLVFAWTLALALTLTSLMRSGPLLPLAGLWYMSTHRTMAVQAAVQLPLMALGACVILRWGARARRPAGAHHSRGRGRPRPGSLPRADDRSGTRGLAAGLAIALVGGVLAAPQRADVTWRVTSTASPFETVVLTDATEALARRAGELLPAGARVLGDPFNGSAYVQVLGGREAVFPQLFFRDSNTDLEYLRRHFNEIATDPQVCRILDEDGIGYAWIDSDPWHQGADQAAVSPGLYGVDVGDGFEVLARAGSATLARITACG